MAVPRTTNSKVGQIETEYEQQKCRLFQERKQRDNCLKLLYYCKRAWRLPYRQCGPVVPIRDQQKRVAERTLQDLQDKIDSISTETSSTQDKSHNLKQLLDDAIIKLWADEASWVKKSEEFIFRAHQRLISIMK